MSTALPIAPRFIPPLDPAFVPASLWNRAYRARVAETGGEPLAIALERSDGSVSVFHTAVLPHEGGAMALDHPYLNQGYVERLLKFLLWQKGGWRVTIAGDPSIAAYLRAVYAPTGARAFDYEFMGERIYGRPMRVESVDYDAAPAERETAAPLGRHLEGCRIGYDLGASDRKCAAVVDGRVVASEEIAWNPATQADPQYHFDGIQEIGPATRSGRERPQVRGGGGWPRGGQRRNCLEPGDAAGPAISFRRHPGFAQARRRPFAARRRKPRQSGR